MKTVLFIHHSADLTEGPQYAKTFDYHNRGAPRADGSLKWPVGHGIQYHFFGERSGDMRDGMPITKTAWHSGMPFWNENGVAVCLAGDFTRQKPTEEQLASLYSLWKRLGYPKLALHSDVRVTTCPGAFDFRNEMTRRYFVDLAQRLKNALHALPRFLGTPRGNLLTRLIERLRKVKGEDEGGECDACSPPPHPSAS